MRKIPSILLVEDEEVDIRMIKRIIGKLDRPINLSVVNNGEQALRYLQKTDEYSNAADIDLILLDINMPKMNGKELLAGLRQDPKFSPIVIVMLTSSEDQLDINSCYQMGANAYICKPIAPVKLKHTLQALCEFWFTTVNLPTI